MIQDQHKSLHEAKSKEEEDPIYFLHVVSDIGYTPKLLNISLGSRVTAASRKQLFNHADEKKVIQKNLPQLGICDGH